MNLTIEMHDPQGQLLSELGWKGVTQESVAITYAYCIAQLGGNADWTKINAAIRERWKGKRALPVIKEMAWKHVESWKVRGKSGVDGQMPEVRA